MWERRYLLALAVLGTLVGHAVAYALPYVDGVGASGVHAYLHVASPLIAVIGAVGLFALVADGLHHGSVPRLGPIICYQVLLFVAQESLEGSAAGRAPSLAAGLSLGVGAVVQVAVATAAVLVVRMITGTLRGLARRPVGWQLTSVRQIDRSAASGRARQFPSLPIVPRAPPLGSVPV